MIGQKQIWTGGHIACEHSVRCCGVKKLWMLTETILVFQLRSHILLQVAWILKCACCIGYFIVNRSTVRNSLIYHFETAILKHSGNFVSCLGRLLTQRKHIPREGNQIKATTYTAVQNSSIDWKKQNREKDINYKKKTTKNHN